jgi:hypothetical protein
MLSLYYEGTLPVEGANAAGTDGPSYPQRICTEKSQTIGETAKNTAISHKENKKKLWDTTR